MHGSTKKRKFLFSCFKIDFIDDKELNVYTPSSSNAIQLAIICVVCNLQHCNHSLHLGSTTSTMCLPICCIIICYGPMTHSFLLPHSNIFMDQQITSTTAQCLRLMTETRKNHYKLHNISSLSSCGIFVVTGWHELIPRLPWDVNMSLF